VDGILVIASQIGVRYLTMLEEMKAPIVLINNHHPGEFTYSVGIDDAHGARIATRHLIELGHRRIAYIGDRFGWQSNAERLASYRRTLKQAGLLVDPALCAEFEGGP